MGNEAQKIAEKVISDINPQWLSQLSFLHIEDQECYFIDEYDLTIVIPILWVKYVDSYGGGKTEQWTTDELVITGVLPHHHQANKCK